MTTPVEKWNLEKFCDFHGEVGHNTDEYMHLKKHIDEMLKAGKLSHLIKELKQNNRKEQPKVAKKGETYGKDKALAILMTMSQKVISSFVDNSWNAKDPVEGGVITLKSSKLVLLESAMVFGPEETPSAAKPIIEERVKVSINSEYPEQTVMIDSTLTREGHNKLCGLLQRNLDIFSWKPADMINIA
nr:hypothetical protein [Tanacetum cinerariifolium]